MGGGSSDPWVRLGEIFSAKLVLEVFGGAGAIWGFSEVVTFRNPDTIWFWRPCAMVFGVIFFVRFMLQIKDYITEAIKGTPVHQNSDRYARLVEIFSAKLVLEVFGGGGAIWGFSEAVTLRNPETQEFWRVNAAAVGFIFFIRFLLQIKDYIKETGYRPVGSADSGRPHMSMVRLVQTYSAKLVLEVFGGAGAVWGFSEVMTWRNPNTLWLWRPVALVAGAIFFIRFMLQIKDDLEQMNYGMGYIRLIQVFSARLVLEVFGGAGAIWGFSEAVTLRNPETVWFWRPCALTFGAIFFVRFMLQIKDFMEQIDMVEREYAARNEKLAGLSEHTPLNVAM